MDYLRNRVALTKPGSHVELAIPRVGKQQTLTPLRAAQFGVVVTAVEPDSVADPAGIEVGTVILQVYQVAVGSAADFARAVEKNADNQVLLLLKTGEL